MKRTTKAISPVIATVILVAVAVVIASGISGLSSSLFGSWIETSNTNSTITTPYGTGYNLGDCKKYEAMQSSTSDQLACIEGKIDRLIEMVKEK